SRPPAPRAARNYVGALAIVTVLSLTLQQLGRLGGVASRGPLAVVASGLLVVGLLRYPVTIDDHAGARDESIRLRAYRPSLVASTSPPPFRKTERVVEEERRHLDQVRPVRVLHAKPLGRPEVVCVAELLAPL